VIRLAGKIVINGAALIAASVVVPHFTLAYKTTGGDPRLRNLAAIAAIAFVFALINSFIKPIVKLLSLPLSLMTLGLVGFLVNGGMLLLLAWVVGLFATRPYPMQLGGFPPNFSLDAIVTAVLASIVISIVSTVLAFFVPD